MGVLQVPVVYLGGDAFARGERHGREAKQAIAQNVETYMRLFEYRAGLGCRQVLAKAEEYAEPIASFSPELMEEIRGIADGAGRGVEEILALNVRSELLFASFPQPEGCTSFAVGPAASRSGKTILAQNWDWSPDLAGRCVLLLVDRPGGQTVLTFTEAGLVGKIGMNSSGVGICLNALSTEEPSPPGPRVPVHILCRTVLDQARNTTDAVSIIGKAERAGPANYLVASRDGAAIDLETTAADFGWINPAGGLLVHANHYEEPRLQKGDAGKVRFPDTAVRAWRGRELLAAKWVEPGVESAKEVLRDHVGWPNSICRHLDERQVPEERVVTVASLVMDLAESTMHFAAGAPCETAYEVLNLEEMVAQERSASPDRDVRQGAL